MKNPLALLLACGTLSCLALPAASAAPSPDKYQATGTITALTDSTITVLKGKENFEMSRDASLKVTGGELKVGAKVTVKYKITAVIAEVKPDKPDPKAPKTPRGAAAPTAPGTVTGNAPQQPAAPAPGQPAGR